MPPSNLRDPGQDPEIGAASSGCLSPGLYVVSTPIGNLGDITLRALDILRQVDIIACEDTRVSHKLCQRYGITPPLIAYHDHNAERVRPGLLKRLVQGQAVALISDAGTPLISDPGYKLVRAAAGQGSRIHAVPGASALLSGLVLSGLPSDRFFFAGFLPPKSAARRRELALLETIPATLVFYETGARLADSLADMADLLGPREAAICREITKLHEETRRGDLPGLAAHYRDAAPPKGELVVLVGPPLPAPPPDAPTLDAALRTAIAEWGLRDAATEIARQFALPRKEIYARALILSGRMGSQRELDGDDETPAD